MGSFKKLAKMLFPEEPFDPNPIVRIKEGLKREGEARALKVFFKRLEP